ncbi:DNA internalization-related competence protein ComEC/Rec2 [Tamaricihabitans halophyticus]|uniref:DNA internalization-related competence protein ComEC/Rec2 n=1 Tax=Tamaricihabitans halophyticus TaxID=1262583 RepID=UPI00311D9A9C
MSAATTAQRHDLGLLPSAMLVWSAGLLGLLGSWWIAALFAVGGLLLAGWWLRAVRRPGWARRLALPGRAGIWALAGVSVLVLLLLVPQLRAAEGDPLRESAAAGHTATLAVELNERPRPIFATGSAGEQGGVRSVVVNAEVQAARVADERVPTTGEVVLLAPAESWAELLPGQRVRTTARLAPARDGELAVAAAYVHEPPRLLGEAPGWQQAADAMRTALREASGVLDPEPAGLLPGLVVGDISALPQRVVEEHRVAGLAHLTAVSGANVAVICGAVLLALRAIRVGPRASAIIAAAVLVWFVILVGPEPSVLRAGVMGGVGLLALVLGKERSALPALAFAVIALVLYDPAMAVSFGFALSVLATAALVLLAPGWVEKMAARGIPRGIGDALAIPAAAQLATAPVLAGMAGQISTVSIIANILAAPVVAPATVLGVLAAAAAPVWPWLAELLVRLAGPEVSWVITVGRKAAGIPGAAISWPSGWWGGLALALVVLVFVVLCRFRRLRTLLLAALLTLVLILVPLRDTLSDWPPARWSVLSCDVGQGDAFLLATEQHDRAVLVDTGPDPALLMSCLREAGVTRIPLVVLSHLHADHVGGLVAALEADAVGAVAIGPGRTPRWAWEQVRDEAARAKVPLVELVAGQRLGWPGLRMDVLGPVAPVSNEVHAEAAGTEINNTSLVIRAHTAAGRVLLTGDIELAAQADLLASGTDLTAEVLKVPHHGSRFTAPELVDAVQPELAMIGVGEDNSYGHPSKEVLRGLAERGVLVTRTDRDGHGAVVADVDGPSLLRRGARRERGRYSPVPATGRPRSAAPALSRARAQPRPRSSASCTAAADGGTVARGPT